MHNTATQVFILLAVFLIGLLGFAVDAIILTPLRIRKARRIAREQLLRMRFAAGITPDMPRRIRRERARIFAKKMVVLARVSGTMIGMPRHEVKRRQKALAKALVVG